MLESLSRYWWLVALRGFVALIFGVLALIWPDITLGALVILFGAYVLVDGISALISSISERQVNDRWWVLLLEGLAGIVAGILTFVWPGVTAVLLLYFIAAWALVTGVLEVVAAIRLRKEIEGEWVLGLGGVASVIFGLLLFLNPGPGAVAVVWLIGAYAIVFGGLLLYLGFKLRGLENEEPVRLKNA